MAQTYAAADLARLQKIEMMMYADFRAVCEKHGLTYWGFCGTGIGALRHGGFIPWDDDIDLYLPRADYEKAIRYMTTEYGDRYYALNTKTSAHYPLATTRLCLKGTVFCEEVMKQVDCPWGIFLDLYPVDAAADASYARTKQILGAWFYSKLVILYEMPRPKLYFDGWRADAVTAGCTLAHELLHWLRIPKKALVDRRDGISAQYNGCRTRRLGYFCDTRPYADMFPRRDLYPLRQLPYEDSTMPFPRHVEKLLTKMFGDFMTLPPEEKRQNHVPYLLDFGKFAGMTPEEVERSWEA